MSCGQSPLDRNEITQPIRVSLSNVTFQRLHYYRLQTKFEKVIFLHVSVCPQGAVPGQEPTLGRYTPPGRYPPGQVPPLGRYTPGQVHPPEAVHAGRYGQQAGGTHPTGMHSCLNCCLPPLVLNRQNLSFCVEVCTIAIMKD